MFSDSHSDYCPNYSLLVFLTPFSVLSICSDVSEKRTVSIFRVTNASTSIYTIWHVEDKGVMFVWTSEQTKHITGRAKHIKPQPSDQHCSLLSPTGFSPTRETCKPPGYLCFRQRVNFLHSGRTANITDTLRKLRVTELGSSISDSAWYNCVSIGSLSATRPYDPSSVQLSFYRRSADSFI